MWALQGTPSTQAALSPPPPRQMQEREAPEESSISNTPVVMLHEVRMKGLSRTYLFFSLKGTVTLVALSLGRTAALWPPLS